MLGVGNKEFSGKCLLVIQLVMSGRRYQSGKGQEYSYRFGSLPCIGGVSGHGNGCDH